VLLGSTTAPSYVKFVNARFLLTARAITCTSGAVDRLDANEGISMAESNRRSNPSGWRALGCGLVVLGLGLAGSAAGAASPTVPGAPTITSVTAGIRSVKVAFTKPADDGGAKVTSYRVKCASSNGGVSRANEGVKSPIRVSGLTAGKSYTCTVAARNRIGLGAYSALSDAVVTLAAVPGAPTITSVGAGVGSVRVAFTKPADNGGAPIINYRARCTSSDGGAAHANEGPKSPIRVSGLTAGKTYTCAVAARNRVGLGAASVRSDPVTPLAH
jgi:hypothetical protein